MGLLRDAELQAALEVKQHELSIRAETMRASPVGQLAASHESLQQQLSEHAVQLCIEKKGGGPLLCQKKCFGAAKSCFAVAWRKTERIFECLEGQGWFLKKEDDHYLPIVQF